MWHDEIEATNASSGSTAAGSEYGSGTLATAAEPGTTAPPSNRITCRRL